MSDGLVTSLVSIINIEFVMKLNDVNFHHQGNWMKFDDDTVSGVPAEEVLKLSGGGMAGLCDPVT